MIYISCQNLPIILHLHIKENQGKRKKVVYFYIFLPKTTAAVLYQQKLGVFSRLAEI